jgi:hypothetical protein
MGYAFPDVEGISGRFTRGGSSSRRRAHGNSHASLRVRPKMDQAFLFVFGGCLGFILGFGVRAMISLRRRREAREILEASERLRASINRTDFIP